MHEDQSQSEWARQRRRMIEDQLRTRGIDDTQVIAAMNAVPRERFIPSAIKSEAYTDRALAIDAGQTISQPYIVAYMTQELKVGPDSRVLEIGTGSGYQTAVLAQCAAHVFSVERIPILHQRADTMLRELGIRNFSLFCGDGTLGWPEHAPFDRILVTAAAPEVPPSLVDQLVETGLLVAPIGGMESQIIVRVQRLAGRTMETPLIECRFVKLVGEQGWTPK